MREWREKVDKENREVGRKVEGQSIVNGKRSEDFQKFFVRKKKRERKRGRQYFPVKLLSLLDGMLLLREWLLNCL